MGIRMTISFRITAAPACVRTRRPWFLLDTGLPAAYALGNLFPLNRQEESDMKWTASIAVLFGLALGLAGCSDDEPSQPKTPDKEPKKPPAVKPETQPAPAPKPPATQPAKKEATLPLKPGYKKFLNEKRGYAVQYPEDWEVSKPMFSHMPVLFLRPRKQPPTKGKPKEFRENFNVGTQKRRKPVDLDASHKTQMRLLKMQMPGVTMVSSESITVNDRPVKKDVATAKKGEMTLKMVLYMLVSDSHKQLYVLSASAPTETFDQYAPVFQDAIETLEILAE